MSGVIRLEIPRLTPSQNELQRMHWHAAHRLLGVYRLLVRNQLMLERHGGPAHRQRKALVLVKRFSCGELDYGNLVGGCKPLIDALQREGVIVDDSPKYLVDRYEQHKAKRGQGRVELEIDYVPEVLL